MQTLQPKNNLKWINELQLVDGHMLSILIAKVTVSRWSYAIYTNCKSYS